MPAVGVLPRPAPPPGDALSSPAWRADLVRRVHGALSTIHRTLDAALASVEPAPLVDAEGVRPLRLDKVVAEAGLLMRCADLGDLTDPSIADALHALAHRLAPLARGDAVLARLCSEPAGAIETASAHVYLTAFGHADEPFDDLLREILDTGDVRGPERLPNHALEHDWLAQISAGVVERVPVSDALLERTCVVTGLDALAASTLDLYAFTHVVLYATDTGRRPAAWPRPLDDIVADAEAALAAALDADNLDLAAELLWTWPMAGLPWSAAAAFAFEQLAAAQDRHGFLPGPQFDAARAASLTAEARDDWTLRTSYHADVVMGILCAATLRSGLAPARPVDAHAPGDSLAAWLRLLTPSTRSPRWLADPAALRSTWGDALAPFVASVALRRAAAAHDLASLRAALQRALDDDLIDGPAVRQALTLLRRATALAKFQRAR